MDIKDLSSNILAMLGFPTLRVELDTKQLELCINKAFMDIQPYITDSLYATIPHAPVTDVKHLNIDYITDVYTSPIEDEEVDYINQNNYSESAFLTLSNISGIMEFFAQRKYTLSVKDRLSHKLVNGQLYIDLAPPYPSAITLEYVPKNYTLESIEDPIWNSLIFKLSLAYAKEILGRIRSKYKVQNSPTELDGEALLSEAQTEKDAVFAKLDEIAYSFFPTD
ncbi:neck protein [Bacillus phage vB_BceM-HSE3]|nr:neck protein [Bacillus phage vB_BceM-HSE3]